MIQTFTQNDLVRHLYTEESKQEADEMNSYLAVDDEFNDDFNDYRTIMDQLSSSLIAPGSDSINFILEYSRITA